MKTNNNPIKRFEQTKIPITGVISLPLVLGEGEHTTTKIIDFVVVRFTLGYNTILGRTSLHDFEVVTSSYHHCLKFRTTNGIGYIRRSQQTSTTCYLATLDATYNAPLSRKKRIIEVMENFVPRFLRKEHEEEEYEIGDQIKKELREEIKESLIKNKDIFAWTQDELQGVKET